MKTAALLHLFVFSVAAIGVLCTVVAVWIICRGFIAGWHFVRPPKIHPVRRLGQ